MAFGSVLRRKLVRPVEHFFKNREDVRRLRAIQERPLKLILGASGTSQPGWTHTDQRYLDLLKPAQWARLFEPASLGGLLAEHVWEHLSPEHALIAARTCRAFLAEGASLRAAVPDGLHPDPSYIEWVRPGGVGPAATDHKVLYDYRTFSRVFEQAGFRVELLEYFDESGQFHAKEWSNERGFIGRSARYDERNAGGKLAYTSLILDAVK